MTAAYPSRCSSAPSIAESQISGPYSDATWMTSGDHHPMGKGQMLYTGPSGIRDYKVKVVTDDRMVGIGTMSKEGTSALQYIWRGTQGAAPPQRRSQWVGEIGWCVPTFTDTRNTMSGNQIQLRVFRKAQEEKYTHRMQEPWYYAPDHPNYKSMFPFTMGSKSGWRRQQATQQQEAMATPPPSRPHTVASFHSEERLPGLANNENNSNNYNSLESRLTSAHPSLAGSRPGSGHSFGTQKTGYPASQSSQFRPPSGTTSLRGTPPGSRPGSGVGISSGTNARHQPARSASAHHAGRSPQGSLASLRSGSHSRDSRGSQTSLQSRGSSLVLQPRRQRITPASTSVTSSYRAPISDPEY